MCVCVCGGGAIVCAGHVTVRLISLYVQMNQEVYVGFILLFKMMRCVYGVIVFFKKIR
jgi:hypothetical protein